MGCGTSSNKTVELSRSLSKEVAVYRTPPSGMSDGKSFKVLLLGSGGSGKSTLFRQMRLLYGREFSKDDLCAYKPAIHRNTLRSMATLIENSERIGGECHYTGAVVPEVEKFKARMIKNPTVINQETATIIKAIWANTGIRRCWRRRAEYQINDSDSFFFDNVQEFVSKKFLPTTEQVLRTRIRTSSIVEANFDIEGQNFQVLDVGGLRTERQKWIHCFEDVTAVIFVAAISEFDQVLREDRFTNRLRESISVYREIMLSKWFQNTTVMLFLNKIDILKEKLENGADLKVYCEGYEGENTFEEVSEFIKDQYLQICPRRNHNVHFTCA
eukprot:946471_1